MGGFFGVASREDCMLDVFLVQITIHTWVPAEADLQLTTKR